MSNNNNEITSHDYLINKVLSSLISDNIHLIVLL